MLLHAKSLLPQCLGDPLGIPHVADQGDKSPPLAPPLYTTDNPLHISDIMEKAIQEEDVDMVFESEMEQYMLQLAEEHDKGVLSYKNSGSVVLLASL